MVFDLDWTLLNSTTEVMVQADSKDTFAFEGKWYRIAHGTAESIIKLHNQGIEISIFSGGTAERNDFAAKLIEKQISLPEAFYYVDPFKTKFPMCGNLF